MRYILNLSVIGLFLMLMSCNSTEEAQESSIKKETIPVKIKTINSETFNHYIEVTGTVEPIEYAFISPETPGQIKQVLVSEGDKVTKGQTLIRLNTSVLNGQIQQIKAQLDLASITFQKQDELWNQKNVGSEMQFLQAKAQKEALENQFASLSSQRDMAIIKAPFTGIVDKINLKEGELASPGMQLIELVNLDRLKIKSEVSEHLLPVIHKGDSVLISFPTYEDINLKAPIYRTANVINPANRTFTVELRIKNIEQKLKPFMISTLKIRDYGLKDAFIVPSITVKKDFDKSYLFLAHKTDSNVVAKKVYVETGRSYKNETVITKGLKKNDKVIVEGYNTVSTGAIIEIL